MWANVRTEITSRSGLTVRKEQGRPACIFTRRFPVLCSQSAVFSLFLSSGELFIPFKLLFYMLPYFRHAALCMPTDLSESSPGGGLTSAPEWQRTELWPVKVAHNGPCGLLSAWKSQHPLCRLPLGLAGTLQARQSFQSTVRVQRSRLECLVSHVFRIQCNIFFPFRLILLASCHALNSCGVSWEQNNSLLISFAPIGHTTHRFNIGKQLSSHWQQLHLFAQIIFKVCVRIWVPFGIIWS